MSEGFPFFGICILLRELRFDSDVRAPTLYRFFVQTRTVPQARFARSMYWAGTPAIDV